MYFIVQRNLVKAVIPISSHDNGTSPNSDYGHIVALHTAKSRIHKIEDNPPLWFKEQFEQSFNGLNPIFA